MALHYPKEALINSVVCHPEERFCDGAKDTTLAHKRNLVTC